MTAVRAYVALDWLGAAPAELERRRTVLPCGGGASPNHALFGDTECL